MKLPFKTALAVCSLACLGLATAAEFKVAAFGAIGDGIIDDGPAIRRALEAAVKASPGSTVVFEKKRYRLAKAGMAYHMDLKGVKGLAIEGNGAELINTPWNNLVRLEECEDVTVRGFVIDIDPLPFTQGTITRVDEEAGWFLLRIHDGYDNPVEMYHRIGNKKPNWGWGVCMDPVKRIRKAGANMHFHLRDVQEVDGGLLKVWLADHSRKDAPGLSIGDRFVITLKYGGGGATFHVTRSKNCRLENNTIYTAKYGMTHSLSDNPGRIHVKGVNITFKPGTDRLISTPKDGFHCKHNAIGPIIEEGLYEGLLDDSINISVCPYWVRKDLGDNRYLIAEVQFSPRVGDELMAFRPNPGSITHGLVVKSVQAQPAPPGMRGKWNVITLNKPIPNLGLHQGANLFPGGSEKLLFTGLYNLSASGKDYIIRGNTFGPQRRHAVLARSSGGLIENNHIHGVGGSGVSLNNEIGSFYEGPLPVDTVIRNNTFTDTFFESIKVYTRGRDVRARNITISGNRIQGWHTDPKARNSASAIHLRNVTGAIITNNVIGKSGADQSISNPLVLVNCKDVIKRDNQIEIGSKDGN